MKIVNVIAFLIIPFLLPGKIVQPKSSTDTPNKTEVINCNNSGTTPNIFCSKSLRIACLGEGNILTVKTEDNSAVESISWTLSDGASSASYTAKEIEVVSRINGLVIATVDVLFSGGIKNSSMTSYWVGPPLVPTITYSDFPNCLPMQRNSELFVEAPGAVSYLWNLPKCHSGSAYSPTPDNDCWLAYDRLSQQEEQLNIYTGSYSGNVSVKAINRCGFQTANLYIDVCEMGLVEKDNSAANDFENKSLSTKEQNFVSIFLLRATWNLLNIFKWF